MAVGGGGQLGDAALGGPPVPGGWTAGAPAAGHALRRRRLRLVPGTPRRPQGAHPLVRFQGFSPRTGGRQRTSDAAIHRRGRHGGTARARNSAHGHREVALLPDPGPVTLRQDRCADGGNLAPGGADGGSGGGAGGTRDRLVRGRQRAAVHARAGRRAGPGPAGRREYSHRLAGTAPRPVSPPGPQPAPDRRLGARRGPLPVALGARLPARLHLRGPFHPGARRWRRPAAGAVSHRHLQTRRGRRHHPAFSRPARYRAGRHQRGCRKVQSDL